MLLAAIEIGKERIDRRVEVMLIHRLVHIMLLLVDGYLCFFLNLGGLLGFESLLWHSNGSWGGNNVLTQDLGGLCVRPGGIGRDFLMTTP